MTTKEQMIDNEEYCIPEVLEPKTLIHCCPHGRGVPYIRPYDIKNRVIITPYCDVCPVCHKKLRWTK